MVINKCCGICMVYLLHLANTTTSFQEVPQVGQFLMVTVTHFQLTVQFCVNALSVVVNTTGKGKDIRFTIS